MGMYCLNMLASPWSWPRENPPMTMSPASFFEHFVHIAQAMNNRGPGGIELWDDQTVLLRRSALPNGDRHHRQGAFFVGLIPLLAVETFEQDVVDRLRFQTPHAVVH